VIPALEVHTGEVAAEGGYAYRVLYIDPGMLTELLGEFGQATRPASVAPAPAAGLRRSLIMSGSSVGDPEGG
jgi:hypothetical protein